MRKILFMLLVSTLSYGQSSPDSIRISPVGASAVIVQIDAKSEKEIYKRLQSFIKRNYKNPDYVVKSEDQDSYIRFRGSSSITFEDVMRPATLPFLYTVEIEVKLGRYKISITDLKSGDSEMISQFYTKNGDVRKNKYYKNGHAALLENLNKLHFDIYRFVSSDGSSEW